MLNHTRRANLPDLSIPCKKNRHFLHTPNTLPLIAFTNWCRTSLKRSTIISLPHRILVLALIIYDLNGPQVPERLFPWMLISPSEGRFVSTELLGIARSWSSFGSFHGLLSTLHHETDLPLNTPGWIFYVAHEENKAAVFLSSAVLFRSLIASFYLLIFLRFTSLVGLNP